MISLTPPRFSTAGFAVFRKIERTSEEFASSMFIDSVESAMRISDCPVHF